MLHLFQQFALFAARVNGKTIVDVYILDSFYATLDLIHATLDLFDAMQVCCFFLIIKATCFPLPLLLVVTHWGFLSFATCYQSMQLICCFLVFHFSLIWCNSFAASSLLQLPLVWCDSFATSSCSPLTLIFHFLSLNTTLLPLPLPASFPPAMQLVHHKGTVSAKWKKYSGHDLHLSMVLHPWLFFH